MLIESADQAVRAYANLTASLVDPKSSSLREGVRVPAQRRCACKSTKWRISESVKLGQRVLCRHCGKPWPTRFLLDPRTIRGKTDSSTIDQVATLGLILSRLSLWEWRVLCTWALWPYGGDRRDEVPRYLRERYPRSRRPTSRRAVADVLHQAREKVQRQQAFRDLVGERA